MDTKAIYLLVLTGTLFAAGCGSRSSKRSATAVVAPATSGQPAANTSASGAAPTSTAVPAPVATIQSGTMTVTTAGAPGEIRVNGVVVGTGAHTGQYLPDSYSVSFGPMLGFVTPATQQVSVTAGATATVNAVYQPSGPAAARTYLPGVRVNPTVGVRGTRIASDPASGHLYAAYKQGGDVWTVKSTDEGATWDAPVRVNDAPGEVYMLGDYDLAISHAGSVLLTWEDRRLGSLHVFLARSVDGGASYRANLRVDSVSDNGHHPSLAADNAGEVYVAYSGYDPAGTHPSKYEVWLTRMFELNATQALVVEPARKISDTPAQDDTTRVAVGDTNRVFVGWKTFDGDLFVVTSGDGGTTFGAAVRVNDVAGKARRGFDLAAHRQRVHVAWGDTRTDSEGDVYFDTADASLGFAADARVHAVTTRYQAYPALLALPTGELHLFWQDYREQAYRHDVYSAASGDHGRTWSASARVNAQRDGDQRKVDAAAGRLGRVHCAWQDDRRQPGSIQFDVHVATGR